jgi:chromosome partitioning protein
MSKPITIAFSNQKGGVGKTTTCREVGLCLAAAGKRVALVDCDPQGNLSRSLIEEEPLGGLYEALSLAGYELKPIFKTLRLLAGDVRLALLEKSLIGEVDGYTRLKELLAMSAFSDFDFILLDSPPSLGVLTLNALCAADYLIVPMNPSLYSMQGTNDLLTTVGKVKKSLNPDLALLGVIINAFDSIPLITRQIRDEIRGVFGERVFSAVLSRSVKVEEAIAARTAVSAFRGSKLKAEMEQLTAEILSRLSIPAVLADRG